MKATEISYAKRVNLGNYEHEEIKITAVLDEGDDAVEGLAELKGMVASAVDTEGLPAIAATGKPVKSAAGKSEKVDKTAKKPAKAAAGKTAKPEPVDEVETEDEETPETTEEEETEVVEEEEEEPEEKPAKKPVGKALKKKGSTYARTNEQHKALMAEKLTELFPKWKKTEESKAKAKAISKSLDGTDFLDAEGDIVPSFIVALKKGMK